MTKKEKIHPIQQKSELEKTIEKMDVLEGKANFGRAVSVGRKALELLRQQPGVDSLKVADLLVKLAEISLKKADFGSALEYYKQAFQLRLEKLGEKDPSVILIQKALEKVPVTGSKPSARPPGPGLKIDFPPLPNLVDLPLPDNLITFPASEELFASDPTRNLIPPGLINPENGITFPLDAIPSGETAAGDVPEVPPPAAKPVAATLTRYPLLNCPDQVRPGQRFSLLVQLTIQQVQPGSVSISLDDTGDPARLPELDIVLTAFGFSIEGDTNTRTLQVNRDKDSQARFVLVPVTAGPHEIVVDFYQGDRNAGTFRKTILVAEETAVKPKKVSTGLSAGLEIKTTLIIPPPDLELRVKMEAGNDKTLYYELHSTEETVDCNHRAFAPVILNAAPLEKVQAIYQELTKMASLSSASGASLNDKPAKRMAALGNDLWDELVPDPMKLIYWRCRANISTLLVTSDEPWIPWEMVKPYRFDDNNVRQDAPFWCEQFRMSRWLSGPGIADALVAGPVRPVAPQASALPSVQAEIDWVRNLSQFNASLVSLDTFAKSEEVIEGFESGAFSILHFACHGLFDTTFPDNTALSFGDGLLHPSDLHVMFGGKRPRPLVFINACHEGQLGFSFTGLGGWADRLVNARIGIFIGAMWEVRDDLAFEFAKVFYTALVEEKSTIGEAFFQARKKIRDMDPNNSTWLSYVLYADPSARLLNPLS